MNYIYFGNSQQKSTRNGSSLHSLVAMGSAKYNRRLHLQQLLPVITEKIDDLSLQNCKWIVSRLATALRQERNRGRRNHWAYSLNRHIGLLQAYRGEREYLQTLETSWPSKSTA